MRRQEGVGEEGEEGGGARGRLLRGRCVGAESGATPARSAAASSPWAESPFGLPDGIAPTPATSASTPRQFFRRSFPPPSLAKHIKESLARWPPRRRCPGCPSWSQSRSTGPEAPAAPVRWSRELDKSFGYDRHFAAKYELGKEVGCGHFGHTCLVRGCKGDMRSQVLAVKVISKAKTTGAFKAAARLASATPPPAYVLSRGIGWQGIGTLLDGLFGTGTGSTVSVENVGLLGSTRVGSRRVIQISAGLMVFFSILGKFGALFASIPFTIFAAIYCVMFGIVGFLQS
ncbi:calcium/calmodulin-dependent serine/threonine-protein kinase 1-like [Miscanthus floridulus]|uniref:calcium/calmodulin-dependent serine/threonine-protein kinase 1-like n=1 Tax=Miscanthus floridulus TaxID=154761 RepID=UPI0034590962